MSLLALPPELREPIWQEVVGQPFIHIHQPSRPDVSHDRSRQRLHNKLCIAQPSDAYTHGPSSVCDTAFSAYDYSLEKVPVCSVRHLACLDESNHRRLSVAFLRTCRQIHYEAEGFVYSTSTFSFDDDRALADFEASLNEKQKSSLSSIHLSVFSRRHTEARYTGHSTHGTIATERLQQSSTPERWDLLHRSQLAEPMARFTRLKYLRICVSQRGPLSAQSKWMLDLLKSTSASENVTVVLSLPWREVLDRPTLSDFIWRPSFVQTWPAVRQMGYAKTVQKNLTSYWEPLVMGGGPRRPDHRFVYMMSDDRDGTKT